MADDPQFLQIEGSALYSLEASAGAPGWVGFVWQGEGKPPATLGIQASFNSGHYLFAAVAPAPADTKAAEAYVKAVEDWLDANFGGATRKFAGLAAIWLSNGAAPRFGAPNATAITFIEGQFSTATTNNFNALLGQITLSVPQGAILSPDARGLRFANQNSPFVDFTTTEGNGEPHISGPVHVPFAGPYAGAVLNGGTLSRSGPGSTLAYFEAGFQFGYTGPQSTLQRQSYPAFATGPGLSDLTYQGAFDPLDPFNSVKPLSDPASGRYRTLFALSGGPAMTSAFRDVRGQGLSLLPQGSADEYGQPQPYTGALVFQDRGRPSSAVKSVVMTLAGDFQLQGGQAGEVALLPGLFGTEQLRLAASDAAGGADILRFLPGQPAHAPVFPFPDGSLEDPKASVPGVLLDDALTTAYATVMSAAGGARYLAQPQGSPLYAPPKTKRNPPGPSEGEALHQPETSAAPILPPLPTPSGVAALPIPLVAYAQAPLSGAAFPPGMLGAFESQIIATQRKRTLNSTSRAALAARRAARTMAAPEAEDLHDATTPQGLYARVEIPDKGEALYDAVVVARSDAKKPATGTMDFGFEFLAAPLQDLFQTNQLMAVIVNPQHLGSPQPAKGSGPAAGAAVFNRDVVVGGWQMSAKVGDSPSATAYSNILILKYCDGTLVDRVKNPNKWVGTSDFSIASGPGPEEQIALAGLSSYVSGFIADGIAKAEAGNTLYANFARIVQDPSWQGFIVLRATVDPSGFPDQIKGLTAGIDFTRFEAHHFGATASRVTVDGETVTMQSPSSLFALVDYAYPAYRRNVASGGSPDMPVPVPSEGPFDFTVLKLQARFENAALVDFRSHIQLQMNEMFLSPVSAAYASGAKLPTCAVVLRGSYQREGETAVYVFEQNSTTVFETDSNALTAVPIERVIFNTLSSGADGTIRSRFLMWGRFEFATLGVTEKGVRVADADLLSFGLEPGDPVTAAPKGLAFSGLEVTLSAPEPTPNAVTYVFEPAKLALDDGNSAPRTNSLFSDLALEIDGFVVGSEDKRPVDFGYLPVSVIPKIKPVSGPWYGIAYKVNMGSPGALVSGAGFASRILLAWSPQTDARAQEAAVYTGLQLPGANPGAKLLSIEGVLKLTMDSLVLRREAVVPGQDPAFVLRLSNIGLTFLGLVKLPKDPINFFLFGDPSGSGSLGWYAAYVQSKKSEAPALIGAPSRSSGPQAETGGREGAP